MLEAFYKASRAMLGRTESSEGPDGVVAAHPLFDQAGGGGSIPTSGLQLRIFPIDVATAARLNRLWHSRLPIFRTGARLSAKRCYGAEYDGRWWAIAIWRNPSARLLPQDTHLELVRFAIAPGAPRYTASRMLAVMARLIRAEFPKITTLLSYQDAEVHKGTIYRAAGWIPVHRHAGGTWNRPNSRNLCGTPRTRPDLNQATGEKVRWEKRIADG